jgi:RNA polymerase sigma-32 factor
MGRIADEDPGLATYFTAVERYELLDREQELALARAYRDGGDKAIGDRLAEANLRFVVRIALGYRGYGMKIADLVEEGNLGLLEGIRRFDPDRGLRFMTYASYWVRAYILAHILKQRSLVGVGTGPLQSRLFFRLARERGRLTAALGENADRDEIDARLAEKFRTTPERIRELGARIEAKDVSLDVPLFRDGPTTGIEVLPDEHSDFTGELDDRERQAELRRRIDAVLLTLAPRERYIVDHRLLADEEQTLAEIGKTLHLSRERVRQLEDRIKQKLRRALDGMERDTLPKIKPSELLAS